MGRPKADLTDTTAPALKPRSRKAASPAESAPAEPGSNFPQLTDKAVIAAAKYAKAAPEKNRLEKRLKELKPVLLVAMGDAPMAYAGKHILTRTDVLGTPDVPGEKITHSMVGQNMPPKKGRGTIPRSTARRMPLPKAAAIAEGVKAIRDEFAPHVRRVGGTDDKLASIIAGEFGKLPAPVAPTAAAN